MVLPLFCESLGAVPSSNTCRVRPQNFKKSMATSPENSTDDTPIVDTLVPFYSNRLWDKFMALLPSPDSSFLAKMMNIFRKISRSKHKRRKPSLPLPLPVNFLDSSLILTDSSKILDILEDIMEHILSSLHHIQKSLLFWKSRAEGTDMQKVRFMILERGPRAFIDGTTQLLYGFVAEGSSMQHLCHSATANISNRIAILTSLQHGLASFLAQFYMEVDKFGDALTKDPDKSLPALLLTINNMFSKLEGSIGHPQSKSMSGGIYSVLMNESNSASLQFEKLPEINQERSQWTECEIRDAINTIYQNLDRLDSYLSFLVSKYQKPRRMTLYWIRYTCGAVGLSVCSAWLLHHSSLMGSSDIDNWIHEAKESTVSFWKDHVELPIISIRDELFETFRTRHKGVMELEEVQLTANSLHRMLLTFSEQTKGQKFPEDASDQEMLEIVMARYEKELMHPIQNLLGGELARALLIQIQKLKLEIETAMLELNQILKANEINFAILAALPAFFLSLLLLMLARAWVTNDKGVEGKGRIARIQRRLLIVEVEKRIMQFQNCMDQGMEEDAWCMFGLLLYSLDRLYKAVERNAQETGEWLSLRQDILDIGKPKVSTSYKLLVTSRMERVYDCLLPSTKRQ